VPESVAPKRQRQIVMTVLEIGPGDNYCREYD